MLFPLPHFAVRLCYDDASWRISLNLVLLLVLWFVLQITSLSRFFFRSSSSNLMRLGKIFIQHKVSFICAVAQTVSACYREYGDLKERIAHSQKWLSKRGGPSWCQFPCQKRPSACTQRCLRPTEVTLHTMHTRLSGTEWKLNKKNEFP